MCEISFYIHFELHRKVHTSNCVNDPLNDQRNSKQSHAMHFYMHVLDVTVLLLAHSIFENLRLTSAFLRKFGIVCFKTFENYTIGNEV